MTKQTNSDHQFTRQDTDKALTTAGLEFYPPDLSEAGCAEVFSEWATDALLWSDSLGWLAWDGLRWTEDGNKALALAIEFSSRTLGEALGYYSATLEVKEDGTVETDKQAKDYLKYANALRGKTTLSHVMDLAKARLAIKADDLDSEWWALNTQAGIVDLRTSQMSPHDPRRHCTKLAPYSPSDTGAEMWQDFLRIVTERDASLETYMQLKLGEALFGRIFHEELTICLGAGRNGKSTFFNSISKVLGSYAGTFDSAALTNEKANKGAELATLRAKRLVVSAETEEGWRLSVSTLKRLASTDTLRIERKYHDPEDVTPSHTLFLFSNFLPKVGSSDDGTWRRLSVLTFNATMPTGRQEILDYATKLADEAGPAVLSWLIAGAGLAWREQFHFIKPEVVENATRAYKEGEDWLSGFLSECCDTTDGNARTKGSDMYQSYKMYAEQNGEYVRRGNDFARAVEERGFQGIKSGGIRYWLGIRLNC